MHSERTWETKDKSHINNLQARTNNYITRMTKMVYLALKFKLGNVF